MASDVAIAVLVAVNELAVRASEHVGVEGSNVGCSNVAVAVNVARNRLWTRTAAFANDDLELGARQGVNNLAVVVRLNSDSKSGVTSVAVTLSIN